MNTVSTQVTITIDGKSCLVDQGVSILKAARENGIAIPTLCHHEALADWGGCRLCVVEVDGSPKLAASCVTPIRSGMSVVTDNPHIRESRRTILEFLFAERNHNCMFCAQSGDCELQALAYDLGMDHVSVPFSFASFPTDVTSDHMAIDHNRCILCGRCVRACRDIVGAGVIGFHNRGPKTMVGLDLLENRDHSSCLGCGACLQVCPTGAIFNRLRTHYAVKGHPATAEVVETFCPACGLMCPTRIHIRDGQLIKVEGVIALNGGRPDHGQLCSRGRFDVLMDQGRRLTLPMQRDPEGNWAAMEWDVALKTAADHLLRIKNRDGYEAIFGWTSSLASNEELMLLKQMIHTGWSADIDTFDGDHQRRISMLLQSNGTVLKEAPWQQIESADTILVLGSDPCQHQPLLSSLIRKKHASADAFVGVIGPPMASLPLLTHYLPSGSEQLPDIVQAMLMAVQAISAEKKSEDTDSPKNRMEKILRRLNLSQAEEKILKEIVQAYAKAHKPVMVIGDAVLADKTALNDIRSMAGMKNRDASESLNIIVLKEAGNSSGAKRLGVAAETPLPFHRYKGAVVRLSGMADNGYEVINDFQTLDYLLVFSPYFPEKIQHKADLLIPIPTMMETAGTYMSLDGRESAYRHAAVTPPKGVRPLWETLCRLMELTDCPSELSTWDEICTKAQTQLSAL